MDRTSRESSEEEKAFSKRWRKLIIFKIISQFYSKDLTTPIMQHISWTYLSLSALIFFQSNLMKEQDACKPWEYQVLNPFLWSVEVARTVVLSHIPSRPGWSWSPGISRCHVISQNWRKDTSLTKFLMASLIDVWKKNVWVNRYRNRNSTPTIFHRLGPTTW